MSIFDGMRRLTKIGIFTTISWVLLMLVVVCLKWNSTSNMGLNEWGDFLAGLSAPLALLWLVIGYFQQAEELRLNTAALKAQQSELARQVKETAILSKSSERQAMASESLASLSQEDSLRDERNRQAQAKPKLVIDSSLRSKEGLAIFFKNIGSTVSEVSFQSDSFEDCHFSHRDVWKIDQKGELFIFYEGGLNLDFPMTLILEYRNVYDQVGKNKYEILSENEFILIDD